MVLLYLCPLETLLCGILTWKNGSGSSGRGEPEGGVDVTFSLSSENFRK